MLVYLQNLSNHTVRDIVVPKIRSLLGSDGQVKHLNSAEVDARVGMDRQHKTVMQAKTQAVGGDLGGVKSLLDKAMRWQGPVDEEAPSKKQKKMASQIVDCYWTAQQVAKSGVRTKELQAEEN